MKYLSWMFWALLIFLMMNFSHACHQAMNAYREYVLPNGYVYSVPESGFHIITEIEPTGKTNGAILGYHLNRAYVDDRYVVGEVLERPSENETTSGIKKYTFFIFDTESGNMISLLSQSEFEAELKKIGIWRHVRLVDRNHKNWLKPQKYRW